MKLDKKAEFGFSDKLVAWYRKNKRDLPWRKSDDPYHIWVSEVMLQQTQVETVLRYYDRFLQRFPDIKSLAEASLAEVLKMWEGLGYYARARNLHKAAQMVAENSAGVLPGGHDELLAIPGIGPYTAAAVASIAFDENYPVVDGNVVRVLARVLRIEAPPAEVEAKSQILSAAWNFLPERQVGDFNQAMMELGATICTPARPKCAECPVNCQCLAYKTMDDPSLLPVKRRQKERPHYDIGVGIVWNDGKILIDQRPENGLLGGLWEFPGGQQEAGETLEQCVEREIRDELDIRIRVERPFMTVDHAYTHFKITLHAFQCKYLGGHPRPKTVAAWRWVEPEAAKQLAFPVSNLKVLNALLDQEK